MTFHVDLPGPNVAQEQAPYHGAMSLSTGVALESLWSALRATPTIGVAFLHKDGTFVQASSTFCELVFGNTSISVSGLRFIDVEPWEFATERGTIARRVCETRTTYLVNQTRDGRRIATFYAPWTINSPNSPTDHVVALASNDISSIPDQSVEVIDSEFASWGTMAALTKRQLEVLALIRSGKSQREVASELGVSQKTIETHRDNIVHRLNVTSTLDAIRIADRADLSIQQIRTTQAIRKPKHAESDQAIPTPAARADLKSV